MDYDTYYLSGYLEQNIRYKIYIWISGTTNGAKDLEESKNIFIPQLLSVRGVLFKAKGGLPQVKYIFKIKLGSLFWGGM